MENVTVNSQTMRFFVSVQIIVLILTDLANAPDPVEEAYNGMLASVIVLFLKMVVDIVLVGIEHISHEIRMIVLWI